MQSFLSRYCKGEYENVWQELIALGETIWEKPFYSDALAVAHETMRRVRYNIELVLQRLPLVGYHLGYDWLNPDEKDFILDQPPIFTAPPADNAAQINELERLAGPLPLSLRAWYETIGGVNFVGSTPSHWEQRGCGGMDVWYKVVESGFEENLFEKFSRVYPLPNGEFDPMTEWYGLDPLQVHPLQKELLRYQKTREAQLRLGRGELPFSGITIASDYHAKYNISGSGIPYIISLPHRSADAPLLWEWHQTTFVNYLRLCCRWGGFPGLERCENSPQEDLDLLTRDLLPI